MSSQTNQSPEMNRADTSEAPIDELLERGEISLEAFALYSAMADRLMTSANAL